MNSPERNKHKIAPDIHWKHFIMICFLFSLFLPPGDSSAQMRSFFQKRHFLYGSVEFDYEKRWGNSITDFQEISQNYTLGFRSFIIDPRLLNYNTSLSFTRKEDNEENAYSLTGINLNIDILETPPRRWSGFRRYIPGPLMLRYSSYANDYNYKSYGIGLIYSIPEEQQKARAKDKKEKDSFIPLPVVYFDYDKTDYTSGNYKNISDLYSLRATLRKDYYNYEFNYEDFSQTGTAESNRTTYTLSPDYTFYDKETKRRIDIDNHIKIEEVDQTKELFLSSSVNMRKPINKDSLYLSGEVEYTGTNSNEEKIERYSTSGSGSYTKVFSPRLKNTTTLSLTYGDSTSSSWHSERISDNVLYEISKLFTSSSGVLLGENENGLDYGMHTQLSTKTKIRTTTGYSYLFTSNEDGYKSAHTFSLLASGPLKENISFNASASHTMQDVSDVVEDYTENILSSSANLFWRLANTSLSLGGNYVHTSNSIEQKGNTDLLSLNGNLSKVIARNIFLNIYTTWTREPDDRTTTEIRPILLWRFRQISIDTEYKYLEKTYPNIPTTTEHRIFIKFVRRFYRLF